MNNPLSAVLKPALLAVLLTFAAGALAAGPAVKRPPVESPKRVLFVGNSYDYYGKIGKETAQFLQRVADVTVQKFYGWH